MVFNAASQLGLPSSELDPTGGGMRVDTLGGRGYDAANPSPDGDEQLELERWLTIDRFVNGLPVFGSQVRGAVSNNGEIARLSARWPRFELESGLVLRSRQSVLDEVADHMWDAELGAAIEVEAQLVYTRAGDKFIPAALVSFSDPLSGEDLVVPLADVADIDLDGVEDALDNCPTTWNPEQRDDDADVEGNACDNCPDAFNPGQEDTFPADPDGVGDACAPIHHGCRLPDDTCEMLGFDDCNAEGGTSMGDDLTENLRFHSKSSIEWDADPSVDGPYALYRGNFDAGSWTYDHACHDESLATPSATDNATPASGTGYYFLSTVKDPCGESAPGASSSGDARPLDAPCP
ncbi:MAG: hypothetical protein GY716_16640 [bacterium]|nr:hypothetical protein [bacterium]